MSAGATEVVRVGGGGAGGASRVVRIANIEQLAQAVAAIIGTGGTGGGTTDHTQLSNRDAANQHPLAAIAGLVVALSGKLPAWTFASVTDSVDAVSWTHYLADASAGAVTVTLPASPMALDQIQITDANNTATTNTITVSTNGHGINGDSDGLVIDKNGGSVTLTFTGSQWVVVGVVAGAPE